MPRYRNGNYTVSINTDDGTKIRYNCEDSFRPDFPESADIKVSDRCNMGCLQCHECSTPNGELADIMSPSFIDTLHPWTELALGGGNVFEHPDLVPFLLKCKERDLIPSITINQKHFTERIDFVRFLVKQKIIYGLGVSLTNPSDEFIELVKEFPNSVIHIINGIVTLEQLEKLKYRDLKVLILGYKTFGRGVEYYDSHDDAINKNQNDLLVALPDILDNNWFKVVSFDNLAIKQLDVRTILGDKWDEFYMGDDGFATMYVDMVKRQFARSSTSTERYPLMDNIKDMFEVVRV